MIARTRFWFESIHDYQQAMMGREEYSRVTYLYGISAAVISCHGFLGAGVVERERKESTRILI